MNDFGVEFTNFQESLTAGLRKVMVIGLKLGLFEWLPKHYSAKKTTSYFLLPDEDTLVFRL